MGDFIQDALRASAPSAPGWLEALRAAGRTAWQRNSMPTRKSEAWKYTNLRALERGGYGVRPAAGDAAGAGTLAACYRIDNLNATTIVFVNGIYSPALSADQLPGGVEMVRFADASPDEAERITQHLGSTVDRERHLFAALNDLWLSDGLFIRVNRDANVEQPLQVVWLTLPQQENFGVPARLLLVLDEGASATVVEHFTSDEDAQNSFTNSITEAIVSRNAHLDHYRLHLEEEHALHIGGVHATLHRDAQFRSFHLALGGALKRIDAVVHHVGEGANCSMDGVYLPCGTQHVDYHTTVEHEVPHCTTTEVFRGIISDRARAVFSGRIHIHPSAQKTSAEMSNRNLLTSPDAEVDTKPELEIYADDVQCAHGATVAQLDEEALYYLCSRGISRGEAEVMLSFGFINELVVRLRHSAIAEYLRPILARRFTEDSRLMRHLT